MPEPGASLVPLFLAPSPGRAVLRESRAGHDLCPGVNPACANTSLPALTRLNPPFALQTEAAAPGTLNPCHRAGRASSRVATGHARCAARCAGWDSPRMLHGDSPVLQGELGQLPAVVQPLELEGPAALRHARQHQAVPLQVDLAPHRFRLKIRGDIVCGERRERG